MRCRTDNNSIVFELNTDPDFARLHVPMSDEKLKRMEDNIVKCRHIRPIIIWNGFIVDGHKRYEICKHHTIPFSVRTLNQGSRFEVMEYLCERNLMRQDLTEGYKKYFIGKRFLLRICAAGSVDDLSKPLHNKYLIAGQLADMYKISQSTVLKYSQYAEALDIIYRQEPEITDKLLTDQLKISIENVIEISRLSADDLHILRDCFNNKNRDRFLISEIWHELQWNRVHTPVPSRKKAEQKKPEIKNMPKYDPDSELLSLTLTIPMWKSSMERVRTTADFGQASSKAKKDLLRQLGNLSFTIQQLSYFIEEADHGERSTAGSEAIRAAGSLRADPDKEPGLESGIPTQPVAKACSESGSEL